MSGGHTRCDLLFAFLVAALVIATPRAAGAQDEPETGARARSARCLLERCRIEIHEDGTAEYIGRERMLVLGEEGRDLCKVELTENSFLQIEDFKATVSDTSGQVRFTRSRKDLQRTCGFGEGFELYADECVCSTDLAAGNYPMLLDYEYHLRIKSLAYWPDWRAQRDVPVESAECVVVTPKNLTFRVRKTGGVGEPEVSVAGESATYVWRLAHLPAFLSEAGMPPRALHRTGLRFSADRLRFAGHELDTRSWAGLSRGYFELTRPSFELGAAQIAFLDSIFQGGPPDEAKCGRLHDMLRRRSRYVAVFIGAGGWVPHRSMDTFARAYGDCKDLSTLYASMLERSGLQARLALVPTRDSDRLDASFPALNGFNHAIFFLVRGLDTTWVDPTCFDCPLGELPPGDQDIDVMAIDSLNGGLVHTPRSASMHNKVTRRARITLRADGSAGIQLRLGFAGSPRYELEAGRQELSREDLCTILRGPSMGLIAPGLEVARCELAPDSGSGSELSVLIEGTLPRAAQNVGGQWFVDAALLPVLREEDAVDLEARRFPLECGYPYALSDSLDFELPGEGFRLAGAPTDIRFHDRFGEIQSTCWPSGSHVLLSRRKTFERYELAPGEVSLLADRRARLAEESAAVLVLTGP